MFYIVIAVTIAIALAFSLFSTLKADKRCEKDGE